MATYLFENPWPLVLLFALGLVLATVLYARNREYRFLKLAALFVLLVPLPFVLDWLVQTPAEQVDTVLDELQAAAYRRDAERLIAALSDDYQHGGHRRDELARLLRRELANVEPSSIQLNGRLIEATATEAVSRFVAVLHGKYHGTPFGPYPMRLAVHWRKQADTWRIVRIERFEPITNTDREIPLTSR